MSELDRLKEAMFKIVDKSSEREEEFKYAIDAGRVVLDAISEGRYSVAIDGDEARELRDTVSRLESKVGGLLEKMHCTQDAPLPDGSYGYPEPEDPPLPATAPEQSEPIRIGPTEEKPRPAPKPVKTAKAMKP